ncbi:hypothetical protein GCM10009765_71780 [Fodinicola feengrottensis]|uniref:Uncharacterized protein n=1 Tax=Fodinicola feengrottensis TaxID=435914 RepID=A0ABN2IVD8_9ACTN
MAISSSDLLYKTSTTAGSAGNTNTQTVAGSSLGKYVSTSSITTATLNNLFPDVTGDENSASNVDYQCMFIHNNHATLTLTSPKAWQSAETSGGVDCAIGLDPAGVTAKGSSSAQAATIANKNTAPSGVTFSGPTTKSGGLSIADIPAGSVAAIWVRRTASNQAALDNDSVTVRVEGDTSA